MDIERLKFPARFLLNRADRRLYIAIHGNRLEKANKDLIC